MVGQIRYATLPSRGASARRRTPVSWQALPGIGPYVAAAVTSISFGQAEAVCDGNVVRVLTRLFACDEPFKDGATAQKKLAPLARELLDEGRPGDYNQAMMELGALVCTPRNPLCDDCLLKGRCTARKENKVETIPALTKRAAAIKRRFIGFIIVWRGEVYVQRRPSGDVNAGFWEFPNWEVSADADAARLAKANLALGQAELFFVLTHSVTRYRNRLEMFLLRVSRKPRLANLMDMGQNLQ